MLQPDAQNRDFNVILHKTITTSENSTLPELLYPQKDWASNNHYFDIFVHLAPPPAWRLIEYN